MRRAVVRSTPIGKLIEGFLDGNENDLSPDLWNELEELAATVDDEVTELNDKIFELENKVEDLAIKVESLEDEILNMEEI